MELRYSMQLGDYNNTSSCFMLLFATALLKCQNWQLVLRYFLNAMWQMVVNINILTNLWMNGYLCYCLHFEVLEFYSIHCSIRLMLLFLTLRYLYLVCQYYPYYTGNFVFGVYKLFNVVSGSLYPMCVQMLACAHLFSVCCSNGEPFCAILTSTFCLSVIWYYFDLRPSFFHIFPNWKLGCALMWR